MAWLNVLGLIFNLVGSGIAAIGVIALERRSIG